MERKKISPNSFQEEIVDFLKEKIPSSFTGKEILSEINKKNSALGKDERTIGSLSGTLKVLCQGGWISKSDEYPARYSYQDECPVDQDTVKCIEINRNLDADVFHDPILQSIHSKADNIRSKIVTLSKRIEQLQTERSILEAQLEPLEDLLSQHQR
jgi:hypothetical protein